MAIVRLWMNVQRAKDTYNASIVNVVVEDKRVAKGLSKICSASAPLDSFQIQVLVWQKLVHFSKEFLKATQENSM